jgi:hypothetical protein
MESDTEEELAPLFEKAIQDFNEIDALFQTMLGKLDTATTPLIHRRMEPLNDAICQWCMAKGIQEELTPATWFKALLGSAIHIEIETRMITFSETDCHLWGRTHISFFDILRNIPLWFRCTL